jgi:glutathione S-transferase
MDVRRKGRGGGFMAIEIYWGSGSPYSWRVLLALEYKRLAYESHLLQFSKQEHKSPRMLRMNPRGRVPVLKDGDYVVFESLACLLYLDRKYPEYPLFGTSAEEAGTIMRVICEYQAYAEHYVTQIVSAVFLDQLDQQAEEITKAMHIVVPWKNARPANSARASCRWNRPTRRLPAGSSAWNRCRGTSGPIPRTGATRSTGSDRVRRARIRPRVVSR